MRWRATASRSRFSDRCTRGLPGPSTVTLGGLLAYAAGRSMEALLAGVRPTDGLTLASAIALTFVMTVLGTLAPTVRALRVDPITALRSE